MFIGYNEQNVRLKVKRRFKAGGSLFALESARVALPDRSSDKQMETLLSRITSYQYFRIKLL